MTANPSEIFKNILQELEESRRAMCVDGPPEYQRGFSSGFDEAQRIVAVLAKKHEVNTKA